MSYSSCSLLLQNKHHDNQGLFTALFLFVCLFVVVLQRCANKRACGHFISVQYNTMHVLSFNNVLKMWCLQPLFSSLENPGCYVRKRALTPYMTGACTSQIKIHVVTRRRSSLYFSRIRHSIVKAPPCIFQLVRQLGSKHKIRQLIPQSWSR